MERIRSVHALEILDSVEAVNHRIAPALDNCVVFDPLAVGRLLRIEQHLGTDAFYPGVGAIRCALDS